MGYSVFRSSNVTESVWTAMNRRKILLWFTVKLLFSRYFEGFGAIHFTHQFLFWMWDFWTQFGGRHVKLKSSQVCEHSFWNFFITYSELSANYTIVWYGKTFSNSAGNSVELLFWIPIYVNELFQSKLVGQLYRFSSKKVTDFLTIDIFDF